MADKPKKQYHVPAPGSEPAPHLPTEFGDPAASVFNVPAYETFPSSTPEPVAPADHPASAPPPDEPKGRRPRRPRRWRRRMLLLLALVIVLSVGGGLIAANVLWGRVEHVAIANLGTDTAAGTNYLIVGTDSRAGVDPNVETAGGIFGSDPDSVTGERTDTILIMRVTPSGTKFLSLNRDLWLPIAGAGEQRINTAFSGGPQRLVDTIQQSLDVPIHHYMEVDFAGFLGLVEALDGIDITVEYPAFDRKTGLDIPTAGLVHLDAPQALAYVRTRTYTEIINGQEVRDPSSDFGRVLRQQAFLRATFAEVGGTRNPVTLLKAAHALAGNVRIDDSMSMWEAAQFGRSLRGLNPETVELPVFDFTGPNGEAVLGLAEAAEAVLQQFRS